MLYFHRHLYSENVKYQELTIYRRYNIKKRSQNSLKNNTSNLKSKTEKKEKNEKIVTLFSAHSNRSVNVNVLLFPS